MMATRAIEPGRASALPLNLIAQALPKLTRCELEAVTERLIEHLDWLDPDPDVEPNGDELDGSLGEDDFHPQSQDWLREPGCPVSDPDMAADDYAIDPEEDMCTAGDHGGGPVVLHGQVHWGSAQEDEGN